ncbi:hypothetical protein [Halioglobus sp. HI00S01]|uniref:hypothetical protein n=1 Tax=Halioglobus sp. HI00S01 TaxID=1822214 RepID=UPI0012E92778|nr:hypothetical protein [Halioglobus sp. HI00S01]
MSAGRMTAIAKTLTAIANDMAKYELLPANMAEFAERVFKVLRIKRVLVGGRSIDEFISAKDALKRIRNIESEL